MAMKTQRLEKHDCFGETPPGNFPDHLITPPNDNGFYPGIQSESLLSQIPSAGCLWSPNRGLDRILSKLQEEEIPGKGYPWTDCPGIHGLWLHNRKTNSVWIADLPTTALTIFLEEATSCEINPIDLNSPLFKRVFDYIGKTFHYIGLSEGVPVLPE